MKKILTIVIALLILIALFWGVSYMRCESLTNKYGDEFNNLYSETGVINDVDFLKVLKYSDNNARVYYASKASGNVLNFAKENDSWKLLDWDTVWSESGSAGGIVWPYIR